MAGFYLLTFSRFPPSDTFCLAHAHFILIIVGVGKERHTLIVHSMVKADKEAPVTGTTLRTTGPVL